MEKNITGLSVVIPAFDEEKGIVPVLEKMKEVLREAVKDFEIIVVNDGSTDSTAGAASTVPGVTVISNPANAGYGFSLMKGFERARYDYVAIIDADGSYPPGELLKLLPYAEAFDMVVGARHGAHYWGTLFKFPIRIIFLWLSEFATGQSIPDANSGLRVFKKKTVPTGTSLCRGFSFSTTMTLMYLSSGKFVKFVPIEYIARTGSSKIHFVRDTLRTAQVIVETLLYYNPLKLAFFVSVLPAAGAAAFLVMFLLDTADINLLGWSLVFCCFALLVFMVGAGLDIVKLTRENREP